MSQKVKVQVVLELVVSGAEHRILARCGTSRRTFPTHVELRQVLRWADYQQWRQMKSRQGHGTHSRGQGDTPRWIDFA